MIGGCLPTSSSTSRSPIRCYATILQAPASIAHYGGIPGGGQAETLEGEWTPKRFVVLEFPSYDRAKEWWACEEYRGPKALRQSASVTNMILVEGLL